MFPAPFVVIVDANLLYPFTLRDTVLRAAAAGFFQLRWSKEILDEVERNLVENGVMPAENMRAHDAPSALRTARTLRGSRGLQGCRGGRRRQVHLRGPAGAVGGAGGQPRSSRPCQTRATTTASSSMR